MSEGAFTHEAGIHVGGLLKDRCNYQGVDPRELGRDHTLVLGKHSGTHVVQRAYAALHLALDRPQAEAILAQIRGHVTRFKRAPAETDLLDFYRGLAGRTPEAACL